MNNYKLSKPFCLTYDMVMQTCHIIQSVSILFHNFFCIGILIKFTVEEGLCHMDAYIPHLHGVWRDHNTCHTLPQLSPHTGRDQTCTIKGFLHNVPDTNLGSWRLVYITIVSFKQALSRALFTMFLLRLYQILIVSIHNNNLVSH